MTKTPEEPRTDGAPAQEPDRESSGHLSPQIDQSEVKTNKQIAQSEEQASGQGSGQS